MHANGVSFSIAAHAAWAPGIETPEAWTSWAKTPYPIEGHTEPAVRQMPAMLRRRAGALGKMALEVAYQCLDGRTNVPVVFCSRHGEVARAVDLLKDMVQGEPVSPTGFGLAVHNASAGLFSIARADHANHLALAAGACTIEHGVIEACSLLADGEPMVLLVAYDNPLPPVFEQFADCVEQPHAWAWLMVPAEAGKVSIHLSWHGAGDVPSPETNEMPAGLQILGFHLRKDLLLERIADNRCWRWAHDA
jgi:hypothetical protein